MEPEPGLTLTLAVESNIIHSLRLLQSTVSSLDLSRKQTPTVIDRVISPAKPSSDPRPSISVRLISGLQLHGPAKYKYKKEVANIQPFHAHLTCRLHNCDWNNYWSVSPSRSSVLPSCFWCSRYSAARGGEYSHMFDVKCTSYRLSFACVTRVPSISRVPRTGLMIDD